MDNVEFNKERDSILKSMASLSSVISEHTSLIKEQNNFVKKLNTSLGLISTDK
jgi:hypothetical protein